MLYILSIFVFLPVDIYVPLRNGTDSAILTVMNKELGKKLKEFRLRKFSEDSIRRVAERLDLDPSYLYRVEEGFYTPKDDKLMTMSKLYNLTAVQTLEIFHLAHLDAEYQGVFDRAVKENRDQVTSLLFRKKKQ